MKSFQEKFIELSLTVQALKFGEFTLKSGRKSPYFFNAGLFNSGSSLLGLAECYADAIIAQKIQFEVLFGPAYKGIPLASAIALMLYQKYSVDVGVAYDRKEIKDHGEGGQLVGASLNHKSVLIVDDVITAGTAIRQSLKLLAKEEADVVGVGLALDRQEKGSSGISAIQELQQTYHLNVFSIVGLNELVNFLDHHKTISNLEISKLKAYQKEYGVL